jgi:hypothetical protein
MFQPLRVLWRPSTYLRWWFPFGVRSVGCLIKTITNQTTAVPLPTTVLSDDSLTVLLMMMFLFFFQKQKYNCHSVGGVGALGVDARYRTACELERATCSQHQPIIHYFLWSVLEAEERNGL